jgi:hypothetical protein
MTTLDLFNMALGMIGHDKTISALPSTSTEAIRCNTFYEAARRSVFGLYKWQWLAQDVSLTSSSRFGTAGPYIHAKPTGTLRVLDVTNAAGLPLAYDVIGASIHTDAATIILRYIADSTDPATWPPLIADAVACELAARIAIPMTSNFNLSKSLRAQSAGYLSEAAAQYGAEEEDQPKQEE